MKTFITIFIIGFYMLSVQAQENNPIPDILAQGDDLVQKIIKDRQKYEVQISYSPIYRDARGEPRIETYTWSVDPDKYFYPASTIKMPVAFFAVEKLNQLQSDEIDLHTPIAFGSSGSPQHLVLYDTTALDNELTLAHLIKKVFLVSDNEAYNLLYAFCGQKFINDQLKAKGYEDVKITHRVGAPGYSLEDNRRSNPILFYKNDDILYIEPTKYNPLNYAQIQKSDCIKGNGYFAKGELVKEPFDFCDKNFLSIPVLHQLITAFVVPEAVDEEKRYDITQAQRQEILSFMGERPQESMYPRYPEKYTDRYVKFFMYGDSDDLMPASVRIFNKVGYAYGYLTDVAYITDKNTGIEFILTATIHVNENGIYNDNNYQYDKLGIPFLAKIGRLFYNYESSRSHGSLPQDILQLKYQ